MCRNGWTGPLGALAAMCLALGWLAAAVACALANRAAGGWHSPGWARSGSDSEVGILLRGGPGRWLAGAVFGLVAAIACAPWTGSRLELKRRTWMFVVVALSTALTRYATPHTYAFAGKLPYGYGVPPGPFDWLVGEPDPTWGFWWRWTRDASGLALAGAADTLPIGAFFYLFGYSWELLLAGPVMAPLYMLGGVVPDTWSAFAPGPYASELLWGLWLGALMVWLCLRYGWQPVGMCATVSGDVGGALQSDEDGLDVPVAPRARVLAPAALLALALACSLIWFAIKDSSSALRFTQTELGLAGSLAATAAASVLWLGARSAAQFAAPSALPPVRPVAWDDMDDDAVMRVFGVQDAGQHAQRGLLGDTTFARVLIAPQRRLNEWPARVRLMDESSPLVGLPSQGPARESVALGSWWQPDAALSNALTGWFRAVLLSAWLAFVPTLVVAIVRAQF